MDDIKRIRRTWAMAAADQAATTQVFYTRLFEIAPETEVLFKTDLTAQGVKLAETLGFVVDHLDDPDDLLPAAKDLAIRHVAYGVLPEHYAHVGAALLHTFKQLLGPEFSDEDHAAWANTYTGLADYMIKEAY
ncbi:MAG: globin domain-containing protein [Planktomarina sp.]